MSHHLILRIVIWSAGLSAVCGSAAAQVPPWNEGPGDIVITRHVPRQNAVLVGEPGRPTLVNPKTLVMGTNGFSVGTGVLTRPLSDLEAEAVRATRTQESEPLGDATDALLSNDAGDAAFAGIQGLGHERTGFLGGAVTGAVTGATGQIQGILSSAVGGGGL